MIKDTRLRRRLAKLLCVSLSGAMMLGAFTSCGSGKQEKESKTESSKDTAEDSDEFDPGSNDVKKKTEEIEQYINELYYFDTDKEKQEESYYEGLMEGLDDVYSTYYTKEQYEEMMEDDSGEFEGIGATVSKNQEDGTIYVVKPIPGSPAEEAGLLPGDVIVKVGDLELTTDMELDYVVKHIRGEKGTSVDIEIYREGEPDFLTFTITRDKITNPSVEHEMMDDKVGYILVEQFNENTPELFKEAVDDLQKQNARAIVFDLRNNPGGYVKAVTEMLDYLIEDDLVADGNDTPGLLLETKDKNDDVLEQYTCSDGHSVDIPMAVVVNGNSASAAEIFTGTLKDYGKAKVVGTTTYGKGIVQSVIKLKDGSAIKLTIAQYFTPSGNTVHKVGIEPDVEVELDEELRKKVTIDHKEDNQLQEAIKQLD